MSTEPTCPGCGYTKADADYNLDHHLCKNSGKAPWERREGESAAAQPRPKAFGEMGKHMQRVTREIDQPRDGDSDCEAVPPAAETAAQDKCARCGCDQPTHEVEISRSGTRSGYCYAHPQDCPSFETSIAARARNPFD